MATFTMPKKSKAYQLAEMVYENLRKLPEAEFAKRLKLIRELKFTPPKGTPKKQSARRKSYSAQ